jgi:hypothetical protein
VRSIEERPMSTAEFVDWLKKDQEAKVAAIRAGGAEKREAWERLQKERARGKGLMRPLPEEWLEEPIALERCKGFRVIEWRPTPGKEPQTSPSPKAVEVLNETCAVAKRAFPAFVRARKLKPKSMEDLAVTICLMPADVDDHGTDYRNLNDETWRFSNRSAGDNLRKPRDSDLDERGVGRAALSVIPGQ